MNSKYKCKTAVAFIIFNRPDTTERVFAEIAQARPPRLLVVADGPRDDRPDERSRCHATRKIIERVNWECEVLTNFSDRNLGCKGRVASGLDWVFSVTDEAIVLEDDCLPAPSFFRFCDDMLERFRNDARVMAISGDNFQQIRPTSDSYYFSRYNHVWGWASWRRAWKHYDVDIAVWPYVKRSGLLRDILPDQNDVSYWETVFDMVFNDQIGTWDYQWTLACWLQSGLTVLPSKNLVSNIGFGVGATHTNRNSRLACMPVYDLEFPLDHPSFVVRNVKADRHTERLFFGGSMAARLKMQMRRWLRARELGKHAK